MMQLVFLFAMPINGRQLSFMVEVSPRYACGYIDAKSAVTGASPAFFSNVALA